ncbi:MAG: hypothetical protein HOO67_04940 [Candidatus Peribacteraceae bacterium]|nr:hypothetical protein [Candidatus Peribacteraceae bacterium]
MESSTSSSSGFGKFLGFVCVVGLIGLIVLLDMRRREAERKYMQISMEYEQQNGNQAQNREAAKEIVTKVRRLFSIAADTDPTVATIVDVEQLRSRNAFYNKAKNGDHLIVTSDRAILYDPVADKIIDVVPVQIQPTTPAAVGTSSSAKAGGTASSK